MSYRPNEVGKRQGKVSQMLMYLTRRVLRDTEKPWNFNCEIDIYVWKMIFTPNASSQRLSETHL